MNLISPAKNILNNQTTSIVSGNRFFNVELVISAVQVETTVHKAVFKRFNQFEMIKLNKCSLAQRNIFLQRSNVNMTLKSYPHLEV